MPRHQRRLRRALLDLRPTRLGPTQTWRQVITTLRFLGYEGILSLEMESEYMEMQEGREKARPSSAPLILENPPVSPWWQIMKLDESWTD